MSVYKSSEVPGVFGKHFVRSVEVRDGSSELLIRFESDRFWREMIDRMAKRICLRIPSFDPNYARTIAKNTMSALMIIASAMVTAGKHKYSEVTDENISSEIENFIRRAEKLISQGFGKLRVGIDVTSTGG